MERETEEYLERLKKLPLGDLYALEQRILDEHPSDGLTELLIWVEKRIGELLKPGNSFPISQ